MYTAPKSFTDLVRNLTPTTGSAEKARLVASIELTLTLALQLGLEAEPLNVGFVLLSRMPLNHPILNRLTSDQRHMLATAAVIVPLSSRFAFESALTRYGKEIPENVRLYNVNPDERFDTQMIGLCRKQPCPDPHREIAYEAILEDQLPFERRKCNPALVGKTYRVKVREKDGTLRDGQIQVTEQTQCDTPKLSWFDSPRPRTVISLKIQDLLPTAEYLDKREQEIGGRTHWVHDLRQIRFRRATWTKGTKYVLELENAHPLHLEGAVHIPGMVSAGKTTLAKLIIAHSIRMKWDVRITLVVGDSHSAVEIAHQINSWFYDDPYGEEAIAIPLLGVSQREVHLGRLLASREYARSLENKRAHWGERWLMPACPLISQVKWEVGEEIEISAGSEPCQGLLSEPRSSEAQGEWHVCPMFNICPSKQIFRDMPHAQVWVTTPGALSQATLPLHLEDRVVTVGDLVYEQSDLVILDEVEIIVDWFDRTFQFQIEPITKRRCHYRIPYLFHLWNTATKVLVFL